MLGAEVAWVTRSAAARGELADLERARKGSRALRARVCSMTSNFEVAPGLQSNGGVVSGDCGSSAVQSTSSVV